MGMLGGRPKKYETPEDMAQACDDHFRDMEEKKKHLTITGLALALGFADRQSLYDNEKREGFSCILKRARLHVENSYEQALLGNNATGPIFALKQMGWRDQKNLDLSSSDGTMTPSKNFNDFYGDS